MIQGSTISFATLQYSITPTLQLNNIKKSKRFVITFLLVIVMSQFQNC